MNRDNDSNEEACQSRTNWWRKRLTGLGKNKKGKEYYHNKTAELTPLGRNYGGSINGTGDVLDSDRYGFSHFLWTTNNSRR